MNIIRVIKSQLWKLRFLIQTNAPFWAIKAHFFKLIKRFFTGVNAKYVDQREQFKEKINELSFDTDWFTNNIPNWLDVFQKEGFAPSQRLSVLEIGSWQGMSSYFIVSYFRNAELTCVDTWGGEETRRATSTEISGNSEAAFDSNLSEFSNRITKFKGSSSSFFHKNFILEKFDLIYVDGAHHSDDLMVDAIKSFESLKVGGLIIFDDYLWKFYDEAKENPAGALNAFLRMKRHQLKICNVGYQLVLRKTSSSTKIDN
tara:strand:+ start:553 stop:1326 length:774 start_codon:yes stop_codon:yes gene_type:complete